MSDTEFLTESRKGEKEKAKNYTPLVQAVVCLTAVLTVFFLSRSGASFYGHLKDGYNSVMQNDISAGGIINTVRELLDSAPVLSRQVNSDTEETSTVTVDSDAKIETVTSSGGEDIRVLDALSDSTLDAVIINKEAVTPVSGRITSPFGYRIHPITGNKSFHTGIDIASPQGTPVASAYDGTVAETGYTNGKGNYVLLDHGDGMQTLYCHLHEINVRENASILAGETVGFVGSTGMSTGPHLHFELRVNGIRCNPVYALKDLTDAL